MPSKAPKTSAQVEPESAVSAIPGIPSVASGRADAVLHSGTAAVPVAASPERRSGWSLGIFWREWLRPFLLILIVLLSFRSAIADWNHVPTGSMRPTILEGDRIFVDKIAYDLRIPFTTRRIAQWATPARGDIVVFLSPQDRKRLVKRVVGVPGDRLEMRRQRLWINGRPANYQRVDPSAVHYLDQFERNSNRVSNESLAGEDPHRIMTRPWFSGRSTFSPLTLGKNQFFVMGDNRDDSADSRVFGTLDRHLILGKAIGVALSVDPNHRYRPRWERFFKAFR